MNKKELVVLVIAVALLFVSLLFVFSSAFAEECKTMTCQHLTQQAPTSTPGMPGWYYTQMPYPAPVTPEPYPAPVDGIAETLNYFPFIANAFNVNEIPVEATPIGTKTPRPTPTLAPTMKP